MNGNFDVLAPLFLQLCISSSSYHINLVAVCTPDIVRAIPLFQCTHNSLP